MEKYLNRLPSDTERIDISYFRLTIFPTELLSRFKQLSALNCSNNQLRIIPSLNDYSFLEELNCSSNQLISLPPLNTSLKNLRCENNQLTSLPPLPSSLEVLYCPFNQLTSLPPLLNTSLKLLNCSYNKLTFIPPINESLYELYCYYNPLTSLLFLYSSLRHFIWNNTPIYALLNGNRENITKFNWFREYYFLSRLKKKFISWMWKSREKAIREQFHYKHLLRFMEENGDLENVDLDPFLENFLPVN
jgi:Leucine-rich repeat (LRR) protein